MSVIQSTKISVVIPVQNEERSIARVIKQIKKIKPDEVIVVVNGSTDRTTVIVKALKCKVITYQQSIGAAVARAVGAYYTRGDIVLFVDGDIVIKGRQLRPFIQAIHEGYDVALNDLTWSMYRNVRPHPTAVAKKALNLFLKRDDLLVNSIVAVPCAFSRQALQEIGWQNLVDPPLTQAIAIRKKLAITCPESVDVIKTNRVRLDQHKKNAENSPYPQGTTRILGDHFMALNDLIKQKGIRGGYYDGRVRSHPHYDTWRKQSKVKRSVVICADHQKTKTLLKMINKTLRHPHIQEVVVVGQQVKKLPDSFARKGAVIVPVKKSLGLYATRVIGAANSTGEVILFINGHVNAPIKKLIPFYKTVEEGIDVVLNNNEQLLDLIHPLDSLSTMKYFLNLAMKRPYLLNNSLVTMPHAIHRRVIDKIGVETLLQPSLAHVRIRTHGFRTRAINGIDMKSNADLPIEQLHRRDKYKAYDIFLGDHIEALAEYINHTDVRGGYNDKDKNRDVIQQL